jgi:hypothetical protein
MSDVRILALEQLDAGSLAEHPDPHFLTAFAEQGYRRQRGRALSSTFASVETGREVTAVAPPPSEVLPARLKSSSVLSDKFSVCSLGVKRSEEAHYG